MKLNLKNNLLNNATLKVFSLIIGYGIWSIVSASHTINQVVEVPLCFYNQLGTHEIEAPAIIALELQAKKSAFRSLDRNTLAIHINAASLHHGANPIIINRSTLFLPDTFNVVHYSPANIVITLKEKITA